MFKSSFYNKSWLWRRLIWLNIGWPVLCDTGSWWTDMMRLKNNLSSLLCIKQCNIFLEPNSWHISMLYKSVHEDGLKMTRFEYQKKVLK